MTTTMQLIAKQTVGAGGASSVTFSNIPDASKGYTDLKIVISSRNADTTEGAFCRFNSDSGTNYEWIQLKGTGSSAVSNKAVSFGSPYTTGVYWRSDISSQTANTFASTDIYLPNYTDSSAYQSVSVDSVTENNATAAEAAMIAGIWKNNAAITSISFVTEGGGNFVEYSTFYLYGISNSTTTQATTVPYASGGDVITTDGSYWYHAFKYSGSFTPLKNLSADILVVAGGGSGGTYYRGGGGGAGGLVGLTAQALTSGTAYTCTIGAGATGSDVGRDGSNSQFGALTAAVGGGGGGDQGGTGDGNGRAGGSGGGGGQQSSSYGTGGAGTSGQGNAGGTAGGQNGGGGGGANAVGGNGSSGIAGAGGNGSSTYSSWLSATATGQNVSSTYYIAGGGSGAYYSPGGNVAGAAGYGGGGTGGSAAGTAGTANTGGGGGGSNYPSTGGNGGSGIVIVRYAV